MITLLTAIVLGATGISNEGWPVVTIRHTCSINHTPKLYQALLDIHKRYPGSCDEVWLCNQVRAAEVYDAKKRNGEAVMADLKRSAEYARVTTSYGVIPGYQQGITLGHGVWSKWMSNGVPDDAWQRGRDGKNLGMICPRSPFALEYEYQYVKAYLGTVKVDSFWLDDDLRMGVYKPSGCFCDRCLKAFNEYAGVNLTREQLVERLFGKAKREPLRAKWSAFNGESIAMFAAAARRAADEVRPSCRLGYQSVWSETFETAENYRPLLSALSGPNHRSVGIRPGACVYNERKPFDFLAKAMSVAREAERCREYGFVGSVCYEQETYPRRVFQKSPGAIVTECTLAIASGCDAVSLYWYTGDHPEPLEDYERFAAAISAARPNWDRLSKIVKATHLGGMARFVGSAARECAGFDLRDGFDTELASFGIPITVAEAKPNVWLLTAKSIGELDEGDLSVLADAGVVVDVDTFRNFVKDQPEAVKRLVSDPQGLLKRFSEAYTKGEFVSIDKNGKEQVRQYPTELDVPRHLLKTGCVVVPSIGKGNLAVVPNYVIKHLTIAPLALQRRAWLDACDAVGSMPVRVDACLPLRILPRIDEAGVVKAVTLVNCSMGETGKFKLQVRSPVMTLDVASIPPWTAVTVYPSVNVVEVNGKAKILGPIGEKLDRFLEHRVCGKFAKNVVFPESRAAFEKPDDDLFKKVNGYARPWGMWKGEFWGKLMLSACRIAKLRNDKTLVDYLHDEALRLIAFQRPDGYLGTYVDPTYVQPLDWEKNGKDTTKKAAWCWNLWCRKYTMWGLFACWEITHDKKLLEAVEKSMDQEIAMLNKMDLHPLDTGTFMGMPSSSVLKPLLLLYRETGKREYLEFARTIVDDFRRDDDRAPNLIGNAFSGNAVADWYPAPWSWAKAYEMMSCLDGLLEWYRVTGETSVLEAMKRVQSMLVEHETNPLFSVGYNDQFANATHLPNGITEPCDAIHWIRFNLDLYQLTGETKYVDAIELAFYNAYLAGMFRDGTWGARGVRSHGYHATVRDGQSGMMHQHCCVNNMPRTIADITSLIANRDREGALLIAFYNDAKAEVDEDKVEISGNYPYGDEIKVTIDKARPGKVRFRVPAWSKRDLDRGTWRTFDAHAGRNVFTLAFDMRPRVVDRKRDDMALEPTGLKAYSWKYNMWTCYGRQKDLIPWARISPAVEIMRGPLLLAKAEVVGTSKAEIESTSTIRGTKPELSLKPIPAKNSVAAWELSIDDGTVKKTLPVCDFPSAGDKYEDGGMRFSVWF